MSVDSILDLTKKISDEIENIGSDIGDCDPEIWEHLFAEEVLDTIRRHKPTESAEETAAFRSLYVETKKVVDQALIPSELFEAVSALEYQIAPTLVAIAKKNKTVGAEILNDLKTAYVNSEDADIRAIAKKTARSIEKSLMPKTEQANRFNIIAVGGSTSVITGKNVVFTGTLSTMTRKEATDIATALGAHVVGDVSKNTHFLVAGKDAGSKITRATKMGIAILSEEKWNEMIGRNISGNNPAESRPPSL